MQLFTKVLNSKIKVIIAIIIALITVFGVVTILNRFKQTEEKIGITDPETLRAMNYEQLTEEDANVEGVDNIKFSAYFLRDLDGDGYAEKYKGTCTKINTSNKDELNKRLLYIDFNVLGDGKFKNGVITINNKNFNWKTTITADNIVKQSYNGNVNSIVLNDELLGGSQKLFSGSISPKIKDNINNYSQISSITLTGTYVDDDGNETPISKTIDLTVDWYGITRTAVNKDNVLQTRDINTLINDEKVKVKFDAIVTETEEELLLQKQVAVMTIPEFNGYKATNAYTTYKRAISEFDSETGKLTITNQSNVKPDGNMQVKLSRSNRYEIVVEYPLEAYTSLQNGSISLNILIDGYNYGFNNSNTEFDNPYISRDRNIITIVYQDIPDEETEHSGGTIVPPKTERTTWKLNTSVGNYIYSSETGGRNRVSKDSIIERYNGNNYEFFEDTYMVTWDVTIGWREKISKIILEEPTESEIRKSDKFLNSDSQYFSMKDYESTVGIEFSNANDILGSDGYIKLYNAENNTLIETFTRVNWNNYYNITIEDLKSIKIETSVPINNGILTIKQIKLIDDEKVVEDFTKEQFQSMRYIYSYLKGTIEAKYGQTFSNGAPTWTSTSSNYAYYEEAVSLQGISIKPNQITNQETKNVKINIITKSQNEYEKKWIDGVFIVEFPEDIIYVSVNDVTSNSDDVEISNWSLYKKDGKYCIRIDTNNDTELLYNITIDADITENPLVATKVDNIQLYAYNPNCNNYYRSITDKYDIDGDFSVQDAVGFATTDLTIIAPSGLLTEEYVTNYDENNSVTIAPNVAEIEKSNGARTATINVGLANNYTGTISDVSILGRVPFEGNKFILINKDMKSEYTAHITGPINVPESQVNNVTIYYSVNGNATKNLSEANNGWVTAEYVTDWSLIKSYLIDFGDYIFNQASDDIFTYEVIIPSEVGYDEATFCNHAVFYNLHTENGLLPIQTEPNRVGIQAVGGFDLHLSKNKMGNLNTKVRGATYKVAGKDANGNLISKIEKTDENGNIVFNDLYIGREYVLEEISCPDDYELSDERIKFNTSVEDGNLLVRIINDEEYTGNFVETPEVNVNTNGNFVANVRLEDEAKYTLNIDKVDESGDAIHGVQFKFGVDGNPKIYVTDGNGRVIINGLDVGKEYKIQEVRADGYYIDDIAKSIRVVRYEENGESKLKVESNDEKYANATISLPDGVSQTQVKLDIINEKIPTYKLQVLKVNKTEEGDVITPLQGAYFRLANADTGIQEEYKTNDNGVIEVDGLYIHIEGKSITGEYVLQETRAPGGYTNSADEIHFVVNGRYNEITESYDLEVSVEEQDKLESLKEIKIENNVLKITIEDKPLFKLTKIDSETGEILSNVEFIIYKVEDDGTVDYAKDEYGNYLGTINETGDYIVTTDENGVITLPLPNGLYCVDEVTYPEGYQEKNEAEYFKVGTENQNDEENNDESGNNANEIVEINYIEDLVEFSNSVNQGNTYENKTIKLLRNLDFNEDSSYQDSMNTTYGDINKNGIVEDIKTELTTEYGFIPIGERSNPFKGTFDGQKHEIRNLYIGGVREVVDYGLFGCAENTTIKNIGISGIINFNTVYYTGIQAGGIVGLLKSGTISNCYNTGTISIANFYSDSYWCSRAGGIVGTMYRGTISNCYNTGEILNSSGTSYIYTGGIVGYVSKEYVANPKNDTISNCYNMGNVSSAGYSNNYAGGIIGCGRYVIISNCYNTGKIMTDDGHAGGIAAKLENGSSTVDSCYNTGNIEVIKGGYFLSDVMDYAGGIVAELQGTTISNCYNTGNVDRAQKAGGIVGRTSCEIRNCYNTGNVEDDNFVGGSGGIVGSGASIESNCYYLNHKSYYNDKGQVCSEEYMKSKEFYQELNTDKVWLYKSNSYPILLNKIIVADLVDTTELTVNNTIRKYKITTEVKEINDYKGGSISGEDEEAYEIVNYNENTTKKIEINPEDGFAIKNISINGKKIAYNTNDDGSYTIESGYFANMIENKHIVVEFVPANNMIYIQKSDSNGNPLDGAEFKVETSNDNPELGAMTKNGTYYFELKNGKYISNNINQSSTTANSYMLLDLTNYYGKYKITVNALIRSEKNRDYGYVTISNDQVAPEYSNTTNRFVFVSGSSTLNSYDYTTEVEGGDIYYIHFGYYKDAVGNTSSDCFTINSVTVKPVIYSYTATTSEDGKALIYVDYPGKYKVSETKSPEHYYLDEEEKTIELSPSENIQTVEFENTRKTEIIVHHYLAGTTNKVAEDDVIEGKIGDYYNIIPHYNLEKLKLIDNQVSYSGIFEEEGKEYIFYYEPEQIKLTIHHYYDGTENKIIEDKYIYTDSTIEFASEGQYNVLTNSSYELKENEDYKILKNQNEFVLVQFIGAEATSIEDTIEYSTDAEIVYYYKQNDVNYKVCYYYDEVLDEDKTERYNELCDVIIDFYEEKCYEGYKLAKVQALDENGNETEMPLTLRQNEEYNVINVYYCTDENQRKDITYTVEYYKDGNLVIGDTQTKKVNVQVLQNTITVEKSSINTVNKYLGYKLDKTSPETIPDEIGDGGVIKVYYVYDDEATTEISYTVEYYKDGSKVEDDTQVEKKTIHVLDNHSLVVNKAKINTIDKYEGCVCSSTSPSTIPNTISNGSVIRIYYISVIDYKFGKQWINKDIDEANKYRTTYTLYKTVNGSESTSTNSNRKIKAIINDSVAINKEVEYPSTTGPVNVTIVGNGTVEFKNLPKYNGANEIAYLVKENKIEITKDNGTSWLNKNLSSYETVYNDEYEGLNRLVENVEKFNITTEIANNVYNQRIGGSITGTFSSAYPEKFGKRYVETVKEGETPENNIVIQPDEGYCVMEIKINGNSYEYQLDENGNIIIPKEYFENIKENKHIVVRFADRNKIIKIIKEDMDGNRLEGAEFLLYNNQDYSSYIGEMQSDPDYEYYFEEMSDGSYVANNIGVDYSTAKSYSEIDCSDITGVFQLKIDATISSEMGYDSGHISIENIDDSTTTNLGYYSGPTENIIVTATLYGGVHYKVCYYYEKDDGESSYDDTFIINDVSLMSHFEYTAVSNEAGEAYIEAPADKPIEITETKAPLGYSKSDEKKVVIAPNEVTFVNSPIYHTITTEIGINNAGERSGGTITGEYTENYPAENNIKFVEIVRETQDATNDIVITPDVGYHIERILINNNEYEFTPDETGKVIIPKSTFENIQENKNVIVFFGENEKTLKIKKVDELNNPVEGAKFKITSNFIRRDSDLNTLMSNMQKLDENSRYYFNYDSSTGKYTSNNQDQNNTTAVSYMTVDLRNNQGDFTFTVNAEVSSESGCDHGYIVISDYDAIIATGTSTGTGTGTDGPTLVPIATASATISETIKGSKYLMRKSGEVESQDYSALLEGGKLYNVYFAYGKDGSESSGTDTFTINSITLNGDGAPVIKETELTDSNGEVTVSLTGYGTYTIEETVTPEHFITMDNQEFELLSTENNQVVTVENIHKPTVLVHHYFKNANGEKTTIKVAEDEQYGGNIGENYTTSPKTNLNGLQQEKVNGEVVIPQYASGIYANGIKEVNYYYELVPITLTIHHYKENTTDKLKEDETIVTTPNIVFPAEGTYEISSQLTYDLDNNENYKELLETYSLAGIINNSMEEPNLLNIQENLNYTSNTVITYYYINKVAYTVHYYYDGVENEDEIETLTAPYKSIITTYEDKANGYALYEVEPVDATTGELALEITNNIDNNRINVFYRTQYKITTEVVKHTETDKDGTVRDNIKGGTISGDEETSFENVFKGEDSTKDIVITPSEDYKIVSIKVNNTEVEFESLLDNNGNVTLNAENGFFTNMNENKHIEVEFRKKSNVIVKYLEKDTNEVLATEDNISGYEGKEYETARKNVSYYQAVNITDEDGNEISNYDNVTSDDKYTATGTMYADTLTIIYWYERIPSGIIVKHIAINEADKQNLTLTSGTELDEETIAGYVSLSETVTRNIYENYIAVDGPTSSENIIVVPADENSSIVSFEEDVVKEVRFYYERQYKITTEVILHEEENENNETINVAGGTISGAGEDCYETINDGGYNSKEIIITPDVGYRIKSIKINEEEHLQTEFKVNSETKVVTITANEEAYFTNVQSDKNITVEFERIPAKVIVKYKDIATNEQVDGIPEKVVEGFVGDKYEEQFIEIPNYIKAEVTEEHPEPTNNKGYMTEENIEVVYWYLKQFKITTSAGFGGTSGFENNVEAEVVNRGGSNKIKIKITPNEGYKISKIKINDQEIDYKNDNDIVTIDGYIVIPEEYFTNIQEDKYIKVEFEKIPAKVIVRYIDKETNKEVTIEKVVNGKVADEYEIEPIEIEGYELVKTMLPKNTKGTMTEDDIEVIFYYVKIKQHDDKPEDEPKEEPKEDKPKDEPKEEPKEDKPKDEPKEEPKEDKPKDEPKEEPKEAKPKDEPKEEPKEEKPKDEPKEEKHSESIDKTEKGSTVTIEYKENKAKEKSEKNIKTGDNIIIFAIVFVGSVMYIVIFVIAKRKKEDK